MSLYLLYPEKRPIDEATVIGWAHDRLKDDAIDQHVAARGSVDHDATMQAIADAVPAPTLDEAIAYLSDEGICTFARGLK
jgi:hypothetical protein